MRDIRRGWWAVVAMFALNGLYLGVWASRVPAVAERYGLSPGGLGLVLLAIGLGAITSFPLAGRFSDKLGAARVTLWLAAGHAVVRQARLREVVRAHSPVAAEEEVPARLLVDGVAPVGGYCGVPFSA